MSNDNANIEDTPMQSNDVQLLPGIWGKALGANAGPLSVFMQQEIRRVHASHNVQPPPPGLQAALAQMELEGMFIRTDSAKI